jgi:hypothetical protein
MRIEVSTFLESGDADATKGFFKLKPRYVVVRSTIDVFLVVYSDKCLIGIDQGRREALALIHYCY